MSDKKTLVSKLVRVMAGVKSVAKNGRNDFQKYDYVTEADILNSIRDNLVKENVFVTSSVVQSSKDGNLTSILVKHTFHDGDTGETMDVQTLAQGSDTSDKGAYKAMTGASKYMFLKNFLIPTGDDPESTDDTGKRTSTTKTVSTKTLTTSATEEKPTYGFSKRPKATVTVGADDAGF